MFRIFDRDISRFTDRRIGDKRTTRKWHRANKCEAFIDHTRAFTLSIDMTIGLHADYIYPQFLWITLWIATRYERKLFSQHDALFVLLNFSSALSPTGDNSLQLHIDSFLN